jgi:Rps23 Pro-64 3,4-dihydroxylase Tpa1-like proline 4-hydroxylase
MSQKDASVSVDSFNKVPPHGLIRNWLGNEAVEQLLIYAQSNKHLFKESRVAGGLDRTRRVSQRLELDTFKNKIEARVRDTLPEIFSTLRVKPFDPTFELELIAHGDGAFFRRHIDTLMHRRRIISAVYYFFSLPKSFFGGVLRLHSMAATGQEGTYIDIPPDYDTFVFFPSTFPHEVLPIQSPSGTFLQSRFAINCWICESAGNTSS